MRDELLKFWNFVLDNWAEEEIDEMCYWNDYGEIFSSIEINAETLEELSEESVKDLFCTLIDIFMDVSGTDNYEEVYEILNEETELTPKEIKELLEGVSYEM